MDTQSPILNVEDDEAKRYIVSTVLRQAGFMVTEAATGYEALQLAIIHPALILLDVSLPDMSGFEVCRQLKATPATAAIPVVYRTALSLQPEDKIIGFQSDAVGFAGEDPQELLATVQAVLRMRQAEEAACRSEAYFRALIEMTAHNIIRVPVVRKGKRVGIIARADLLNRLIELEFVTVYGDE